MNTKKLKLNILKRLEAEFKSADIAATLLYKDEEKSLPTDILTALITQMGIKSRESYAEIGFIPQELDEENEEFLYFVCSLKLAEGLYPSPENIIKLNQVMSKLNFALPFGALSFDNTALVFKTSSVISPRIREDDIAATASAVVGSCIAQANMFIYPLMELIEGRMEPEEVYEGILV